MWRDVMLCLVLWCDGMWCHVMSCHVIWGTVIWYEAQSGNMMHCHSMQCDVMWCDVMWYNVMWMHCLFWFHSRSLPISLPSSHSLNCLCPLSIFTFLFFPPSYRSPFLSPPYFFFSSLSTRSLTSQTPAVQNGRNGRPLSSQRCGQRRGPRQTISKVTGRTTLERTKLVRHSVHCHSIRCNVMWCDVMWMHCHSMQCDVMQEWWNWR